MPLADTSCRWILNRTNAEYVDYVSRLSGLSAPVAQALINRGIKTAEELDAFLSPSLTKLSDPFSIPGMAAAVQRISAAIKTGERILVHGDYDADGVTATAIMVEALRRLGSSPAWYIPDRLHGYGLGAEGVEAAREQGAKLIITVDCGITSFDAVAAARASGIDVVITDHHEPASNPLQNSEEPFILPDAVAITNPKLNVADPSLWLLSGAGVAFKLSQALSGNRVDAVAHLLDLAALGTAADVVPLKGDNRIIISEGFKLIASGERAGIRALKEAAGVRADQIRMSSISYMLVPRINAAGRIANASDVVKLLITESYDEAARIAGWLNELNLQRQKICEEVRSQAMELIVKTEALSEGAGAVVVASENWHPGVLGIVAAKIADSFYRPAFVFNVTDGVAKGSGRSIPQFDMHKGLASCAHLLSRYGGHKQAAGLSLAASDLDRFRDAMSGIVRGLLTSEELRPSLSIDAALRVSDINCRLAEEITRLEPFGYDNEEPVFGARGLNVHQSRIVGNNHLKMYLKQDGRGIDSIGFDLGAGIAYCRDGDTIDAAFVPTINEWNGSRTVQMNIKAVRPSANCI